MVHLLTQYNWLIYTHLVYHYFIVLLWVNNDSSLGCTNHNRLYVFMQITHSSQARTDNKSFFRFVSFFLFRFIFSLATWVSVYELSTSDNFCNEVFLFTDGNGEVLNTTILCCLKSIFWDPFRDNRVHLNVETFFIRKLKYLREAEQVTLGGNNIGLSKIYILRSFQRQSCSFQCRNLFHQKIYAKHNRWRWMATVSRT